MKKPLKIRIGETHTRHFDSYKDAAEFLCIKNGSRKSIEARCKVSGFEVNFDE